MTPEELIKLCDEAEGDHLAGRPCPECDARDELYEDFGFSSPARARSYAALLGSLQWAVKEMKRPEGESDPHGGTRMREAEAALATEEKE